MHCSLFSTENLDLFHQDFKFTIDFHVQLDSCVISLVGSGSWELLWTSRSERWWQDLASFAAGSAAGGDSRLQRGLSFIITELEHLSRLTHPLASDSLYVFSFLGGKITPLFLMGMQSDSQTIDTTLYQ